MRLHTDALALADVHEVAGMFGIRVLGATMHGSRKRDHAIEVGLSGSGRRGGQWGNTNAPSATWDEWGLFLAELFRRDPGVTTRDYETAEHFRWSTGGRFDDPNLTSHAQHRWSPSGATWTGAYAVAECKCGAIHRWTLRGHAWEDVA